jgi:transcriptional regulator with XRE-family HTH domain
LPDDAERARLARTFGATLRRERGVRTQQQLADAAKLDRKTMVRLENGQRRPTAASIWAIARALRSDLRSRVALDERLRRAAGSSFRDYGKRPHRAREAMRVQLAAEQGGGPVFGPEDTLGGAITAFLDDLARGSGP